MITATRYHDFSCGHRVAGHESKCAHLHGHNYRVHFTCSPADGSGLDSVGRVVDFSVIASHLCEWLEREWDHRMLIYILDPMFRALHEIDPQGVKAVAFNPTAENMALHLLYDIGPAVLRGTGCELVKVVVEETRKCSAAAQKGDGV